MPPTEPGAIPSVSDRFAHIVAAIGTVQENLHGISEEGLADDGVLRLALERLLEIVIVASAHIPANLKAIESTVDWQAIADIGDRLENTRVRIDAKILWMVSQDKLIPLKSCAERYLREPA
jgi:uncharacterized protein with HEPN domain